MRLILSVGLALALVGGRTSGADAQSLKVRQIEAKQEQALTNDVELTNKACGTSLTVTFDWTAALAEDLDKYSAESFCDGALGGIRRVCDDPVGKDAVKQKIKSVTCSFAGERTMSLKDGAIDYKINFNSANDADYVYEYLENNL